MPTPATSSVSLLPELREEVCSVRSKVLRGVTLFNAGMRGAGASFTRGRRCLSMPPTRLAQADFDWCTRRNRCQANFGARTFFGGAAAQIRGTDAPALDTRIGTRIAPRIGRPMRGGRARFGGDRRG